MNRRVRFSVQERARNGLRKPLGLRAGGRSEVRSGPEMRTEVVVRKLAERRLSTYTRVWEDFSGGWNGRRPLLLSRSWLCR